MTVKAVLFDVGGVLFFHVNKRLSNLLSKKTKLSPTNSLDFIESKVDSVDRGDITERQLWTLYEKNFNIKIDFKKVQKLHRNSFRLRREIHSLAKKLSKNNVIGILSNMPHHFVIYLKKNYDFSFFDYIFFSSEWKLIKPTKKFYLLAAKRMKLKPSEIVFIDDKMVNVNGAKEAGMKSFQYKSLEDTKKKLAKLGIK